MDRKDVIKAFKICDNNEDGIVCKNCPYKEDKWNGAWWDTETDKTCFQTLHADVYALLKEQEDIKEQFIEAFNTIRDAYNAPANREKILMNYLARNACCCEQCNLPHERSIL